MPTASHLDNSEQVAVPKLRPLYVAVSVTMAGISAIFALFAEFEKRYELSTASLGLIAGMSFAAALVAQLSLARYADRGYSNLLLRSGLFIGAIGLLWFAVAANVWQFMMARGMLGLALGAILPAARRAVLVGSEGRAGERLGVLYAWYLSGFVLGPPLAGVLTVVGDVRLPFVVFGLASLAVWTVVVRSTRIPEAPRHTPDTVIDKRVLRRLIRTRAVIAALLVAVSFRYSIGVFEPLWAVYLDRLGASTIFITVSLVSFALPMVLIAKWAGRLSDRFGPRLTSLIAAAATVPLMAVYGHITALPLVFFIVIPHGLLEAVQSPGIQAAIADAAPPKDTASAQGLGEAAGSAAAAVGAFTAAPLFAALGPMWAWTIAAGVMAGLLATSAALEPPRVRQPRINYDVANEPSVSPK
jgi:MFS family permease